MKISLSMVLKSTTNLFYLLQIISGFISPTLEGVTIKIYGLDKESPVYTLVTKQDGKFRVGPLEGSLDYTYVKYCAFFIK